MLGTQTGVHKHEPGPWLCETLNPKTKWRRLSHKQASQGMQHENTCRHMQSTGVPSDTLQFNDHRTCLMHELKSGQALLRHHICIHMCIYMRCYKLHVHTYSSVVLRITEAHGKCRSCSSGQVLTPLLDCFSSLHPLAPTHQRDSSVWLISLTHQSDSSLYFKSCSLFLDPPSKTHRPPSMTAVSHCKMVWKEQHGWKQ